VTTRRVSEAFPRLPKKFRTEIQNALEAIDRVHSDGVLPTLELRVGRLVPPNRGEYRHRGVDAQGIAVTSLERFPGFALTHEIGHLLDHQVLGERGVFASSAHPNLASIRQAWRQTQAYWRLEALVRAGVTSVPGELVAARLAGAVVALPVRAVWAEPEEWFARSYAQFIALESAEPSLLAALEAEQARALYLPLHPSDDDFVPVAHAFRALFNDQGWSKPRRTRKKGVHSKS
jgi:hypothetical protein